MNHYVKLLTALSTGTLVGCTQFALAPTQDWPATASGLPKVQPVDRISSPVTGIDGLFIMGRAAHGAGELAQAEGYFEQVLSKQASHLGALNSLAVIYAQTGRMDKALELFKRALDVDPKASHIQNNLGYALLLAGRLDEAESALRLAQELNPSSLQTQQNMELLTRAKGGATMLAALASHQPGTETVTLKNRLVAVSPNVYELRDVSASKLVPGQILGLPETKPVPDDVSKAALKDSASNVTHYSLHGIRIEVSNGVGIRHMARRTAQRLAPMGLVTARLTNQPGYRQAKTEIQFSRGHKQAADELSARLPLSPRVTPTALGSHIQMRLVLGHDLVGKAVAAWLESGTDTSVALAGYDGWRWS